MVGGADEDAFCMTYLDKYASMRSRAEADNRSEGYATQLIDAPDANW